MTKLQEVVMLVILVLAARLAEAIAFPFHFRLLEQFLQGQLRFQSDPKQVDKQNQRRQAFKRWETENQRSSCGTQSLLSLTLARHQDQLSAGGVVCT